MTDKANDNNAAKLDKRLKAIIDYVRDCQARVAKGENLSLEGLDIKVVNLCNDIAVLPEKEGRGLESQMNFLIESLEILARELKEQQELLTEDGEE